MLMSTRTTGSWPDTVVIMSKRQRYKMFFIDDWLRDKDTATLR
jgi:hypothetical protein